jgi:hypothetical protein
MKDSKRIRVGRRSFAAIAVTALLAFWLFGVFVAYYVQERNCFLEHRSCEQFRGRPFKGVRAPWNGFGTYDPALDQRLIQVFPGPSGDTWKPGSAYDTRNYETSLAAHSGLTLVIGLGGAVVIRSRRKQKFAASQ